MGGMRLWEEPKPAFTFIYDETPPPPACSLSQPRVESSLCHHATSLHPSLPSVVSYQTDGFFHMAFHSSLPRLSFSPSRSITLTLCGSVGCSVFSRNNLAACILSLPSPFFVSSFIYSCCFVNSWISDIETIFLLQRAWINIYLLSCKIDCNPSLWMSCESHSEDWWHLASGHVTSQATPSLVALSII